MEISDDLLCLFTAQLERNGGHTTIDVPESELEQGELVAGETYRVALLGGAAEAPDGREPPVDQGEVRQVEIEGIGDQGDGIARVDRGYVVIVPGTDVGDSVEVEIEDLRPNFAMARVVDGE